MKEKPQNFIQVTTVAKRLDISRPYVYRLIREGKLAAIQVGSFKGIRVSEKSLNSLIKNSAINPADYAKQ